MRTELRRSVRRWLYAGVTALLWWSADARSETLGTEAETLVGPEFAGNLASDVLASNRLVFVAHKGQLTWNVPVVGGAYRFWILGRSGWSPEHRFYADGAYYVQTQDRKLILKVERETLVYGSPESNYAWFRSELVELPAGRQKLRFGSTWDFGKLDGIVLTSDAFKPPRPGASALSDLAGKLSPVHLVWTVDPYEAFSETSAPPEKMQAPSVDLMSPRNASAYAAIAIHQPKHAVHTGHVRLRVTSLKSAEGHVVAKRDVELHGLATLSAAFGGPGLLGSDALPPLGPLGYLSIARGASRCVWFIARVPKDQPAGVYRGSVVIEEQHSMARTRVPITLEVANVRLPERTELAVYTWWRDITSSDAQWDAIVDEGINTFGVILEGPLEYELDAEGKLIGQVQFDSDLERLARAQNRSGGYVLLEWYFRPGAPIAKSTSREGDFVFMTSAWKRAFAALAREIHRYFETRGVPRDRLLHYLFDETLGDHFVETAKFVRSVDPTYRIFANGGGDIDTFKRAAPYVDVWCPHVQHIGYMAQDGRLDFLRSTGKSIWIYDEGYHQRADLPYVKYRLKSWLAYKYGLHGCGNWKHHGLVGMTYESNYGLRVTSRRYEAWRSGVEDYKLLALLRVRSERDDSVGQKSRDLLDEALEKVWSNRGDSTLAETYRRRIIRTLEVGVR